MLRRGGGLGALQAQQQKEDALRETGEKVQAELLEAMRVQLRVFQENLEKYAREHRKEIQENPELRAKFHKMCANLGVDPLTSSKDMWSTLGMGDFYFELAVRIVEICLATRSLNGGIIDAGELIKRLQLKRITYTEQITIDDIDKAVKKLRIFGGGFALLKLGKKHVVRSVPIELSRDHAILLQAIEQSGRATLAQLRDSLKWEEKRLEKTLEFFLENQMVWVDDQAPQREFWFLGLVQKNDLL